MLRIFWLICSYNAEEMKEYILHLLLLSHVYVVPHLKRECERQLENGLLNIENLIDVFQLALLCDAPRLSLICHRMILDNFKAVSATEGWNVMKEAHPMLEKEILRTVNEANAVSILFLWYKRFKLLTYHRLICCIMSVYV